MVPFQPAVPIFAVIHVLCGSIQTSVPPCLCHPGCVPYSNSHIPSIFSFAHAVCVTPSNHSLFNPCCLYGPIQPAAPLLHAIHAVCSPFSCPCPFSLISMLCAWSLFSQPYPIPSVTHMRVLIQPAIHIRAIVCMVVVCMVPFQPAMPHSLCLPSAIHALCVPLSQPHPFYLLSMVCAWSPFSQLCPIPSVFRLPSMLCVFPSASRTPSLCYQWCVHGSIQPAVPHSPCLPSAIHALCVPLSQPHPFSLLSVVCA